MRLGAIGVEALGRDVLGVRTVEGSALGFGQALAWCASEQAGRLHTHRPHGVVEQGSQPLASLRGLFFFRLIPLLIDA